MVDGVNAGVDDGSALLGFEAFSICSRSAGLSLLLDEPPFTATLIANDNTIRVIANAQVPFSKKSPVFCTPINCDELEKFDAKPPPLGFWISTISPNRAHTITVTMIKTIYISLY